MATPYSVEIGTDEVHNVTIARNWFSGKVEVECGGKRLGATRNVVGGDRELEVTLGKTEKHELRLVVKTPRLFPAFKQWPFELYVDGKLTVSATV